MIIRPPVPLVRDYEAAGLRAGFGVDPNEVDAGRHFLAVPSGALCPGSERAPRENRDFTTDNVQD